VDTFEDTNLKNVWARHFPKRAGSLGSRLALINLSILIKHRVGSDAEMAAALQRYGISAEEWNQFHAELIAPK
jgi:hypothetical protein